MGDSESCGKTPPLIQTGPGIVIFGSSMHVCYTNPRARDLIAQAADSGRTTHSMEDLRIEIIKLGARVKDQVSNGEECNDASRLRASKTVETAQGPMLLRAFVIPGKKDLTHAQIMIVLEQPPEEPTIMAAQTSKQNG